MPIIEVIFLIGFGAIIGGFITKIYSEREEQKTLDDAFYRLISAQDGHISLIQLAAAAKVDANTTQEYLNQQVKLFSAMPEVDDLGNTFYRFPKLSLPPSLERQW